MLNIKEVKQYGTTPAKPRGQKICANQESQLGMT